LKFRDLTIKPISDKTALVIACDVSAGIGEKPDDLVHVTADVTAAFALRVPLMELLCFGATPISVVDTVGNEMTPTGENMIAGLKQELKRAGLSDISLNGSTEDNMPTRTTSIGVTVIGIATRRVDDLFQKQPMVIYQLGRPLVGDAVKQHFSDLFSYNLINELRSDSAVIDMLPVGSKGIAFEINQLAKTHQLKVVDGSVMETEEMVKSAGPATVALIGVKPEKRRVFERHFPQVSYLMSLT